MNQLKEHERNYIKPTTQHELLSFDEQFDQAWRQDKKESLLLVLKDIICGMLFMSVLLLVMVTCYR